MCLYIRDTNWNFFFAIGTKYFPYPSGHSFLLLSQYEVARSPAPRLHHKYCFRVDFIKKSPFNFGKGDFHTFTELEVSVFFFIFRYFEEDVDGPLDAVFILILFYSSVSTVLVKIEICIFTLINLNFVSNTVVFWTENINKK